jgi:hypothetical protein
MAAKKKSARKGGRGRKTAAPDKATARPASLDQWVERFRSTAAASAATGVDIGACLVSDPAGGPAMCITTDRATCGRMKGRFLGGPC